MISLRRMTYQWQLIQTAVMFYTRIPVSRKLEYSDKLLNASRQYFPLVGIIVGLVSGIVFLVASTYLSAPASIVLAMISSILLTGAFHEDGFADTCDGLGGGWHKDDVLRIMKDSRLGTYGATGLLLILALKFSLLLDIIQTTTPWLLALILVMAHTISRQISSSVIELFDYVQDTDMSKVKPITDKKLERNAIGVSWAISLIGIWPILYLIPWSVLCVIVAALLVYLLMRRVNQRIGGYTGDILGACQQFAEVVIYLGLAVGLSSTQSV